MLSLFEDGCGSRGGLGGGGAVVRCRQWRGWLRRKDREVLIVVGERGMEILGLWGFLCGRVEGEAEGEEKVLWGEMEGLWRIFLIIFFSFFLTDLRFQI